MYVPYLIPGNTVEVDDIQCTLYVNLAEKLQCNTKNCLIDYHRIFQGTIPSLMTVVKLVTAPTCSPDYRVYVPYLIAGEHSRSGWPTTEPSQ